MESLAFLFLAEVAADATSRRRMVDVKKSSGQPAGVGIISSGRLGHFTY